MQNRDWHVDADGCCRACKSPRSWDLLKENYRFYRFLTEVEDALELADREVDCLPTIRKLVRKLTINSYWLQTQYLEPSPKKGDAILLLYDEIGFPLTVQTETLMQGQKSSIHNHGTWGVIAILKGQEKNSFWHRTPNSEFDCKIELVEEKILHPGDIISFTPDAIHSVEAVSVEPTIAFNIYGETTHSQRFEFDPVNHTARNF
ncbi:hypothetical protein [Pseudanabaena sp. PCC 6802]|uniref:cysteine dioxygenase family protein n=1 Tax=Pseudanabaena sp. PCC 6802 TaxID=118173 RepID=UPI000349046D|nr:hypothetical protein [Pseudanabaena sp. PCC 6802]